MTLTIGSSLKLRKTWLDWLNGAVQPPAKPAQALQAGKEDGGLVEQYRQALDLMPGIFLMVNWSDKRVIFANQGALTFYGLRSESGKSLDFGLVEAAIHPEDQEQYKKYRRLLPSIPLGDTVEGEVRCRNYQDQWAWLHFSAKVISRTTDCFPEMVLWYFQDVTAQKNIEERLVFTSYHDSLTGLYNRAYFEEELNKLEGSRSYPLGVLMVDIDNMKYTNDHLGHSAGDELLCRTARVLRSVFRHEDVIARIGGDEFAALLPKTDQALAVKSIARVRRELARVNAVSGRSLLCLSLGIAVAAYGSDLRHVLRQADEAMYREKDQRGSRGRKKAPRLIKESV